ncbi:MAG: DUF1800 family protein [Pseudomonadota bacterium]
MAGGGDGGAGDDPDTGGAPAVVQSLPLSPPADFQMQGEIELSTVENNAVLPERGATLFGMVADPEAYDMVMVTVEPSGREEMLDVGPTTGQFAMRLFPEDLQGDGPVTVQMTAMSSSGSDVLPAEIEYSFTSAPAADGIEQALGRISFGATEASLVRIQEIGFEAFVQEQLDPANIDDSAFESSNPDRILNLGLTGGRLMSNIIAYNINHAAFSERQLQEVMTLFWSNHFHAVPTDRSAEMSELDEWQGYRALAFSTFGELLEFSAKNPNMMAFLDNEDSRFNSLNQNYAREILELHTVGVNGGYTDDDIDPVARIFTGWTRDRVSENPNIDEFVFEAQEFRDNGSLRRQIHDPDDKFIPFLNVTIEGNEGPEGIQEGEQLLEILSMHPSTQSFVCGKLAEVFVSDSPDAKYANACAAAWQSSGGQVAEFVGAILLHPDYLGDVENRRNKVKTPYEFAVSYLRNFSPGYMVDNSSNEIGFLTSFFDDIVSDAGMNFNFYPVPTGFSEKSSSWNSTGTLIEEQRGIIDRVRNSDGRYDIELDMTVVLEQAGLETAEEVAAYLLGLAAIENYSESEFNSLVAELKGTDNVFSPYEEDEDRALERGLGLIVSMPSFKMQ